MDYTKPQPLSLPNNTKPEVQKLISGEVVTKKKGIMSKFLDTFTETDNKSVGDYIVNQVIVPTLKRTMYDIVMQSLSMKLFGVQQKPSIYSGTGSTYYYGGMNYSAISSNKAVGPNNTVYSISQGYQVPEIILSDPRDADVVMENLLAIVQQYRWVSVEDLYHMIGKPTTYVDRNYGWDDLGGMSTKIVPNGVLLILPRLKTLEK